MKLQGHSYKPCPKFFGTRNAKYHLGIELEMEAPDNIKRDEGLKFYEVPSFCYAKRDGSLAETGWELVTHPISKESWMGADKATRAAQNFFKLVESLRSMGYSSHKNGRCGLHIHVSLKAFGPHCNRQSLGTHFYWFSRVVNSNLFRKLSQRKDKDINQWSKICAVSVQNYTTVNARTRYVCTNIGEHTVEIRLFRGNMREERIRKAIESVICAVEYSRKLSSKDYKAIKENPDHLINGYVEEAQQYPNLTAYLEEIGIKKGNPVCA